MLLTQIIKTIKNGQSGYINSHFDNDIDITNAASIEFASKSQITFLEENNYLKEKINTTKASAIILFNDKELLLICKQRNISTVVVQKPKIAFSELLNDFEKK
tara:strand:- start:185 stop:493 length:309 start_codon:yes stop_codon:yes gene_type:complete